MAVRKAKAKGGRVTKATGGRVKKVVGGLGVRTREAVTRPGTRPTGILNPAQMERQIRTRAAQRSLKKKPPGRAATRGIGMSKGGRVSKARGGKAKR